VEVVVVEVKRPPLLLELAAVQAVVVAYWT